MLELLVSIFVYSYKICEREKISVFGVEKKIRRCYQNTGSGYVYSVTREGQSGQLKVKATVRALQHIDSRVSAGFLMSELVSVAPSV